MDVIGSVAGSKSYDLESFTTLTADMQIRFRVLTGFDASGEHINFDNVDIALQRYGHRRVEFRERGDREQQHHGQRRQRRTA